MADSRRRVPGAFSLFGVRSRKAPAAVDIRRLEEKHRQLAQATEHWLGLLREMERTGESDSKRYDIYFRSYIEAREQEKRADLELFNHRRGLVE